jgi:Protein of unknown function (DUF3137)
MQSIDEFRLFYNHTIHPELLRLEKKRKRLLWLLFFSSLLFIVVLLFALFLQIFFLFLIICIPIGLYINYLYGQVRKFQLSFKPHVVRLILDFIDNDVNFGTLRYEAEGMISKQELLNSRLFITAAPEYMGEDYIAGKIGELDFELCELDIREFSRVRSRLDTVFRGIFLHAVINREMRGSIIILPEIYRPYMTRTIKAFNLLKGHDIETEHIHNEEFAKTFMTYATDDANIAALLSDDMQQAILSYREETGHEIYLSFIEKDAYIAVTEPNDILEPMLFQSNVSFELVREFYEKLVLLMSIVTDIDTNN